MSNEPEKEFDTENEIVAYLDGELSSEQASKVEQRLANDEAFRLEAQKLQKSWEMLDILPHSTASHDFTQSTVDLATRSFHDGRGNFSANQRSAKWIVLFFGAVFAALISYMIAGWLQDSANQELVRDLPLIESFEVYKDIESIELLEHLDEARLFTDDDFRGGLDAESK